MAEPLGEGEGLTAAVLLPAVADAVGDADPDEAARGVGAAVAVGLVAVDVVAGAVVRPTGPGARGVETSLLLRSGENTGGSEIGDGEALEAALGFA